MKRITSILVYALIVGLILVFSNSCEKDDPKSVAVLSTTGVIDITQTSAVSGGNITNDGGAPINAQCLYKKMKK